MLFQSHPNETHEKLLVLYLLRQADVELSELQIVRIMSELALLDYFSLKKALYFLVQNQHIEEHVGSEQVSYSITPEGLQSLATLEDDIRLSMRDSVDAYLRGRRSALERESQFRSALLQDDQGNYSVRLEIFTEGRTIFSLTLDAGSREEAQQMVRKWKDAAIPVYQSVLANLC